MPRKKVFKCNTCHTTGNYHIHATSSTKTAIEQIREFAADERDNAERGYQETPNDYNQGYYIAMNTIMKFIEKL